MKTPRAARILGKVYSLVEERQSNLDPAALGRCINQDCVIYYASNQDEQQKKDTVLHECIHAIDYAISIGLEERQVHALAAGVLMFLRENKNLAKWLVE